MRWKKKTLSRTSRRDGEERRKDELEEETKPRKEI